MRMLPNSAPRARVIYDLVADDCVAAGSVAPNESRFVVKGTSVITGNGRAVFIGLAIGAALIVSVGHFFNEHQRAIGAEPISLTKFVRTHTHTVSASAHPSATPAPIVVEVDAKLIHVSAIALGHPRIAVINGQSVAEGEYVKIRSANPTVSVSLRVLKIADRRIDLTDGRQNITAHLAIPELERTKPL